MNCIWDIALQAVRDGFAEEDLFFLPADDPCPYMEQSFKSINERHVEKPVIEVNPLARFSAIFDYLLHPDIFLVDEQENQQFILFAFDALYHFLLNIDFCHGMTRREFYIRRICRELRQGVYGKRAAEAMALLAQEKQLEVAEQMLNMMECGMSTHVFCEVMRQLFPGCIVYENRYHPQELLVYVPQDEDTDRQKIWQFVRDSFLSMDLRVEMFWKLHFGILGVDGTMRADLIALF